MHYMLEFSEEMHSNTLHVSVLPSERGAHQLVKLMGLSILPYTGLSFLQVDAT